MHTFSDFMFHLKSIQSSAAQKFHALPFYWDHNRKLFVTDATHKLKYFEEFLILTIYYAHVTVQFVRLTYLGKLNEIYVLYIVFMSLTVLIFQNLLLIWKLSDCIALLNRILYFARRICRDLRKGYDPNKNRQNWLWDKLAVMNMVTFFCATFIFSAHFFIFPTDPVYPVSHIVKLPLIGTTTYFLFGLLNFYIMCKVMCNFLFMTDNIILMYFTFWDLLLRETRMGLQKYKVSNNLRRVPNIMYVHRALQIFLAITMETMGLLLPITHLIVIKLSLYSKINLIRKWSQMDHLTIAILMFSWITGQIVWLFALHFAGKMVKESKRTVGSWKAVNNWGNSADNKFMAKFMKSCKPMTVNYHNIYVLKRSSILRFLKTVCRGTLRALLTIRKVTIYVSE